MRIMIGKRIGPVPISLVAVLALAAFISAGLWLTPNGGAQANDHGDADCTVRLNGYDPAAETQTDQTRLGTNASPLGQDCYAPAGSAAEVALPGDRGADPSPGERTVWVYAMDGTIAGGETAKLYAPHALPGDIGADATPDTADDVRPAPRTVTFSYVKLEIDPGAVAGTTGAGVATEISQMFDTVSVTVASGKDAAVLYVYYQDAAPFHTGWDHDGDGSRGDAVTPTPAVRNRLLGIGGTSSATETGLNTATPPAVEEDVNTDIDAMVTVNFVGGVDMGNSSFKHAEDVPDNSKTVTLTLTVLDENDNPIGGQASLEIVGAPASVEFEGDYGTTRRLTLEADGTTDVLIMGLPEDVPLRLTVTATIGGETITGYIIRKGLSETVTAAAYKADCKPGPTTSTCTMIDAETPLAPGEMFWVEGEAEDAVGNDVTETSFSSSSIGGSEKADRDALTKLDADGARPIWWDTLSCKEMVELAREESLLGAGAEGDPINDSNPYCVAYADLGEEDLAPTTDGTDGDGTADNDQEEFAKSQVGTLGLPHYFGAFMVNADTSMGAYNVKVTDSAEAASATVSLTVSGKADMISVTCDPEQIPRNTGLTDCMVTVTDASGNIPSNLTITSGDDSGKNHPVTVTVRSTGVQLIGVDILNQVRLEDDGTARFRVLLREDAPTGDITVNVIANIGDKTLLSSTTVMYRGVSGPTAPTPNRAPMAQGTIADVMINVGDTPVTMNVMGYFSDADNDALTYSAFSDNVGVATASVAENTSAVTITAVAEGTANITVQASDGEATAASQMFMVTVGPMPVYTLGMPSGLMADGGDGSVTLTWTDGENASVHWIAGISQTDRAARDYSNVVFMAAESGVVVDGLTNGEAYDFTVIAGRDTDDGAEWSAWHAIVSATPMAPSTTGGGPGNPFG